jgi:hypothetical protein
MLRVAAQEAARTGLSVEYRAGSSDDLCADLGTFCLVVIGRAFHWMDREQTLCRLDSLVVPGGAVVLFGDDHPQVPENGWCDAYDRVIDRYAAGDAARTGRWAPGWLRHEAILLDSPFPFLERIGFLERRHTPLAALVDRAMSLSSVCSGESGFRADDLARDIREVMASFARDDIVTEVIESQALIARPERPTWPAG